jgi:hypothetical protein
VTVEEQGQPHAEDELEEGGPERIEERVAERDMED